MQQEVVALKRFSTATTCRDVYHEGAGPKCFHPPVLLRLNEGASRSPSRSDVQEMQLRPEAQGTDLLWAASAGVKQCSTMVSPPYLDHQILAIPRRIFLGILAFEIRARNTAAEGLPLRLNRSWHTLLYNSILLRTVDFMSIAVGYLRYPASHDDAGFQFTAKHSTIYTFSYKWGRNPDGDASLNHDILIENHLLKVTGNLFDFSKRSHPKRGDGVKNLWIDAVCINQADVLERNTQVSMMAEIYSKVSSTIIWIGEDHEGDEDYLAMEALAMLQDAFVNRSLSISGFKDWH